MRADPEGVLEAAMRAYAMGDLEAAAAYFADNAIYAIYIEKDVLPFGGTVEGRAAILETWGAIMRAFELLRFDLRNMSAQDEIARCQTNFTFRHRTSDATIEGVLRIVAEIKDGKITRFREYHDQERIRAFMRLVESPFDRYPDRERDLD